MEGGGEGRERGDEGREEGKGRGGGRERRTGECQEEGG